MIHTEAAAIPKPAQAPWLSIAEPWCRALWEPRSSSTDRQPAHAAEHSGSCRDSDASPTQTHSIQQACCGNSPYPLSRKYGFTLDGWGSLQDRSQELTRTQHLFLGFQPQLPGHQDGDRWYSAAGWYGKLQWWKKSHIKVNAAQISHSNYLGAGSGIEGKTISQSKSGKLIWNERSVLDNAQALIKALWKEIVWVKIRPIKENMEWLTCRSGLLGCSVFEMLVPRGFGSPGHKPRSWLPCTNSLQMWEIYIIKRLLWLIGYNYIKELTRHSWRAA